MLLLNGDAETSSPVDLRTAGSYAYARHPETRCLIFVWRSSDLAMPPIVWLEGWPVPQPLIEHIVAGGKISGWNVTSFDRLIYNWKLVPQHGFPPIQDDDWLDSMQMAAAANLPRSLDKCAAAIGVPHDIELKDQNRIRRITDAKRTVIPAPVGEILASPDRFDKKLVEDLHWLVNRCVQDTAMEAQILARLPAWPGMRPWLAMPHIDRRINDRGVMIDLPLVQGLARAAAIETTRLDGEMAAVTGGAVPRTTNIEALKEWLVGRGIELPPNTPAAKPAAVDDGDEDDEDESDSETSRKSPWRMRKGDIADILARTDLPEDVRLAVGYRAEAAKASTAKLRAMMRQASPDWRLHGALLLGGAQQTMRFSGAAWQPHNLVRDVFAGLDDIAETNGLNAKKDAAEVKRLADIALRTAIDVGRSGDPDLMRMLYQTTRKDAQGRSYVSGVIPWISRMLRRTICARAGKLLMNGDWAQIEARITVWLSQQLDILNAFASGEDVYRIAAAGIFRTTTGQITKAMRQTGKVSILALGFGGGINALIAMAMVYGILMSREEAEPIVKAFREANDKTRNYWYATDDAACWAVQYPGREFPVPPLGAVSYFMLDDCLCCRLPSGRLLRYWQPRLHQEYWPDGRPKERLSLTGLAIKGRAVFRRSLYHTILVENCLNGHSNILTCHGVKHLIDVQPDDLLWDGLEWVSHKGVIFQGVRQTIDFGGVRMTSDHKVIHGRGWTCAGDGSFGDATRTYRRYFVDPRRRFSGGKISRFGRATPSSLASSLRLWKHKTDAGGASEARSHQKLWLPEVYCGTASTGKCNTRHVQSSSLLGLAVHARSLSAAVASGLAAIRRARNYCVSRMGYLRELLGGHGANISTRFVIRAHRQQPRLQQNELYVGYAHHAKQESPQQRCNRYALGSYNSVGSSYSIRTEQVDDFLPDSERMAGQTHVRSSEYAEPVYDILNAGPRHRFTVVAPDGQLIVVSNCVQAIGADLLCEALNNFDEANIPIVLHVHDSSAAEEDEDRVESLMPMFNECMLNMPAWSKGLPVAIDSDISARFG